MIGRPLVHELAIAVRIREQHPARAAPHGLAHGDELRPPSIDGPEIPHERVSQRPVWLTVGAETVEVQLVQDHRIRCDQLFALEAVDHEHGRRGKVQRGELRGDRIQAFHGATVVVLPVAHDQLFRESLELLRIT